MSANDLTASSSIERAKATSPCFLARNSRWRTALLFLGCIGFLLGGLYMIGAFGDVPTTRRHPANYTITLGWFTIVFWGLTAFDYARKYLDMRVQLEIGPIGIRWTQWSDDLIPWSEIDQAAMDNFFGQKALVLHLKDRARFPAKGLVAKLLNQTQAMKGGHINISFRGLDRRFEDASSAIAKYGNFFV